MLLRSNIAGALLLFLAGTSLTCALGETPGESEKDPFTENTFIKFMVEGQRAFEQGNFDRAIELTNLALALDLDRGRASGAMCARGSAYAMKGDLDQSLRDFDQSLKFNPANLEAYRGRGLVWCRKGDYDSARKDFDEAIRINPRYTRAYQDRAGVDGLEHNMTAALDDLNKAIGLNAPADTYGSRAVVYLKLKQDDKALADCDRAIQLDRNAVRAYSVRAYVYARAKRYAEAKRDLDTLAALKSPKDPGRPLNSIAWIRATCPEAAMRDGARAVEVATKACEVSQWKKWSYIDTLGASFAEAGDFDKALKFSKQALEMIDGEGDPKRLEERIALYQQHKAFRDDLRP